MSFQLENAGISHHCDKEMSDVTPRRSWALLTNVKHAVATKSSRRSNPSKSPCKLQVPATFIALIRQKIQQIVVGLLLQDECIERKTLTYAKFTESKLTWTQVWQGKSRPKPAQQPVAMDASTFAHYILTPCPRTDQDIVGKLEWFPAIEMDPKPPVASSSYAVLCCKVPTAAASAAGPCRRPLRPELRRS